MAYNKGAKITVSAYYTGMVNDTIIANLLLRNAVYNNSTIIGFTFEEITNNNLQKSININTLN